jgi:hypothetical protein
VRLFRRKATSDELAGLRMDLEFERRRREMLQSRVTRMEAREKALLEHLDLYVAVTQPRVEVRSKGGPESGE